MTDMNKTPDAAKANLLKRIDRLESTLQTVFLHLQTAKDFNSFRASTDYLWDGVAEKGERE